MILSWDKPEKVMTTREWQAISADGAPPGVYTPNMSAGDMATWKARYVGGRAPRVEIRKTVLGPFRPAPASSPFETQRSHAQILVIVDSAGVRLSANGTADFAGDTFTELPQAVAEATAVLRARRGGEGQ